MLGQGADLLLVRHAGRANVVQDADDAVHVVEKGLDGCLPKPFGAFDDDVVVFLCRFRQLLVQRRVEAVERLSGKPREVLAVKREEEVCAGQGEVDFPAEVGDEAVPPLGRLEPGGGGLDLVLEMAVGLVAELPVGRVAEVGLRVQRLCDIVERHGERRVLRHLLDAGDLGVRLGRDPGVAARLGVGAEGWIALDRGALRLVQRVELRLEMLGHVLHVDADLGHVGRERDRGVDLRLDVIGPVDVERRLRVVLALERSDGHLDGRKVGALGEEGLHVVVGGDLALRLAKIGVVPHEHRLDAVLVDHRALLCEPRERLGHGTGERLDRVPHHLAVPGGGGDQRAERAFQHVVAPKRRERGLLVGDRVREILHGVAQEAVEVFGLDGEPLHEEGVAEGVGALLLDVLLEHDHGAAVGGERGVGRAAGDLADVERGVHGAVLAARFLSDDLAFRVLLLRVFGEELRLHLVAELQIAAGRGLADRLLDLEGVEHLPARLQEGRLLLALVEPLPADEVLEVHVDRELVVAERVADLARLHLIHPVGLERGLDGLFGVLRPDGAFRGRADEQPEVRGRHVAFAARALVAGQDALRDLLQD